MRFRFQLARTPLLALPLLAMSAVSSAQTVGHRTEETGSAAWVVSMFYAHPSFPERASHITGEFREHYADAPTMGSHLPPTVRVSSRPLRQDSAGAVFATSLSDGAHAQDWYTYLRREDAIWKIEAVRTLSFPRAHYMILDSLDARRARGVLPDSLVFIQETMRLAVRSDSALKQYLTAHKDALRRLAERFAAVAQLRGISVDGDVGPAGALPDAERRAMVASLRELRLGALLRDSRSPACVFLKIGGAGDNYVGFIYAPTGCTPPPLSPTEFIYVEEVAPHWLVYKTT